MTYKQKVANKLKSIQKKHQNGQDIIVLSIESSCDETSMAIVKNGRDVLSNVVSSQIEIHKRFGGVVPEVASRNHVMAIDNVLSECLSVANVELKNIDAVCVTYGAGLSGALMVGVNFAKGLAYSLGVPLVAVNHIKGHISANYIQDKNLTPPFMCLVVSGGHTAILKVDDYINHTFIGGTVDDAVGECFDKVARVLGLGYPGGPKIDKLAKEGKPNISFINQSTFKNSYSFSFSGLKTAIINYIHHKEQSGEEIVLQDVCASFEQEAIMPLVEKTIRSAKENNLNIVAIAGGVAANTYLREQLRLACEQNGIEFHCPEFKLCTDNGAMIGCQGYYNLINNVGISELSLSPVPSLKL